jgi:hypothetical protein
VKLLRTVLVLINVGIIAFIYTTWWLCLLLLVRYHNSAVFLTVTISSTLPLKAFTISIPITIPMAIAIAILDPQVSMALTSTTQRVLLTIGMVVMIMDTGNTSNASRSRKRTEVRGIADDRSYSENGPAKTIVMVFSSIFNYVKPDTEVSHPMHLHGHSFYILHIGHGRSSDTTSMDLNCEPDDCNACQVSWMNGRRPNEITSRMVSDHIQKDTVIVPTWWWLS